MVYGMGDFGYSRTVEGSLGAGGGALVAGVTRNTHGCGVCRSKMIAKELAKACFALGDIRIGRLSGEQPARKCQTLAFS